MVNYCVLIAVAFCGSAVSALPMTFSPSSSRSKLFQPIDLRNDNMFALNSPDMLTLQEYVQTGISYSNIRIKDQDAVSQKAVQYFRDVGEHCTDFQAETFPKTVALADDIVRYARGVPAYYNGIINSLKVWNNGDLKSAYAKIKAILNIEQQKAYSFKQAANAVAAQLESFGMLTQQDKINLESVVPALQDRYNTSSFNVQRLNNEVASLTKSISDARDQYNSDSRKKDIYKTVSAFVIPDILVFPLVGLYRYSERTARDEARIDALNNEFARLQSQEKEAIEILSSIRLTLDSVNGLTKLMAPVIQIVNRIENVWTQLGSELESLGTLVQREADAAALCSVDPAAIQNAINEWNEIGKLADQYRQSAFVIVRKMSTASPRAAISDEDIFDFNPDEGN